MSASAVDPDALRRLIRELVNEAVASAPSAAAGPTVVSVRDDAELNAFAVRLLDLFEDDRQRAALRSGQLRFRLASSSRATPAPSIDSSGRSAPSAERLRVERTLTEKIVDRAAKEGRSLVLARRAVVTPLARDRARSLGIPLEREA